MNTHGKKFEVKKTFGLSVLLKLTRKSVQGVEIFETNGKYTSNLDLDELSKAVTSSQ
jgi:hypothetical protein